MTDIVQLIKAEIERRWKYDQGFATEEETKAYQQCCDDLLSFINSLPEEPASEDLEQALSEEWQGYVDRGAATVDALEDNTQKLAFAKGFYRCAQRQKQKTIDKACEWLEPILKDYAGYNCGSDLLNDFRKALEEY